MIAESEPGNKVASTQCTYWVPISEYTYVILVQTDTHIHTHTHTHTLVHKQTHSPTHKQAHTGYTYVRTHIHT